jgi:hypothetical protein
MASPRPVKRQRTESAEPVEKSLPADGFEQSSEVWYEDGNVIIRAFSFFVDEISQVWELPVCTLY